MKGSFRNCLLALAVIFLLAPNSFAEPTTITILHVNDTHSHLDSIGPKDQNNEGTLGGIAKAATLINSIRQSEPNVLLLHAGDSLTGDFLFKTYRGVEELKLMQALGFDAMAVGNHDFDLKPDGLLSALKKAFRQGSFPLLSANLDMSGYSRRSELRSYIKPSTIVERSGVKIGIFGMTIPDNPGTLVDPIELRDNITEIAGKNVKHLRDLDADLVICLSHLGRSHDRKIASRVSGIDVIVGGHDHYLFRKPLSIRNPKGEKTLIVQAGEFYKYIGKLTLEVDNGNVAMKSYRVLSVDENVEKDPIFQATIEELKAGVVRKYGNVYNRVARVTLHDLDKSYDPKSPWRDTPMGNLITDAMRKKAKADIAITATGMIGEKIYAGNIVDADVFRCVPYFLNPNSKFGFKLVKVELTLEQLLIGLEATLSLVNTSNDFLVQVSGMTYSYDPQEPVGRRLDIDSIRIGGEEIDFTDYFTTYTIVFNQGVDFALSEIGPVMEPISREVLPYYEYEVVRDYLKSSKKIPYRPEGRIRDQSVR